MPSALLFIGITFLLILEGALTARLILRTNHSLLLGSLGLPISAFTNVLVVFTWTIFGVALTPLSLIGAHLIITVLLATVNRRTSTPYEKNELLVLPRAECPLLWERGRIVPIICCLLIGTTVISSFAHAVLLPTFQYDSATNWTMRSEISFVDRHIAFDPTEVRGMAKPQYPFLFHALQITANQGQSTWNDTAANTILWLLSITSFLGLFLILRKLTLSTGALVTLTLILGIPLLSLHLGQGYADITLTQELLLSLACLFVWVRTKENRWLLFSAIIVASGVWTKSEGLLFGFIPWLLVIAGVALINRTQKKYSMISGLIALGLSLPWQLFAWSRGLLLTPHSSDTLIGFHREGLREAFFGLFDRGSFGIVWYALIVAIPLMMVKLRTTEKSERAELLPLMWGLIILAEILFIYLFTPNVRFLLNAESYYRQMMIPAAMLILSAGAWFSKQKNR